VKVEWVDRWDEQERRAGYGLTALSPRGPRRVKSLADFGEVLLSKSPQVTQRLCWSWCGVKISPDQKVGVRVLPNAPSSVQVMP